MSRHTRLTCDWSSDVFSSDLLNFAGGTMTLESNSTLTAAGTVSFSGATVDVNGSYTVSGSTAISGGTANFNGNATSAGGRSEERRVGKEWRLGVRRKLRKTDRN